MTQVHLLDRMMGEQRPDLSTDALLRAFEATPYDERIAAQSTYEALQRGAAHNPDAPALQFLPNADPAETPVTLSHRQFMAGVTQTASVHLMSYPDRPVRLGSVGHPGPYSRVRVVQLDASGRYERDCAVNEIGTVAMQGPGVFSGYLSEEHNRTAFVEPGWVNSGDLGRLDEDGYLWITGRAKDLIIRSAHNIDPIVIEEILFRHPAVALAAVVGEPDAYAGELPVAYVQLKPQAQAEPADLLAYIAERTPERAANPVQVYLIAAIPLTAVGKIFKPQLRWDAAQRKVMRMLADLQEPGLDIAVSVAAHAVHGNLITVHLPGWPESQRDGVEREMHKRLDPLVMRHEVAWG